MGKLMHSYSHRLRGLPSNIKVQMILTEDQCHYWYKYVKPYTNLSHISANLGTSTYQPLGLYTAGTWSHSTSLTSPTLPPFITEQYKDGLAYGVPPLKPGTNWANWSNTFEREIYLQHALEKLNLEYPPTSAD